MKYYNIEAFSGFRATILEGLYSSNDASFLNSIYHTFCPFIEKDNYGLPYMKPTAFKETLEQFFNNYEGNKVGWINHTMNIVSSYNDKETNNWLWYMLQMAEKKQIPAKSVVIKYMDDILKREGSLESKFKSLADIYGHSWKTYNQLWKAYNNNEWK